VPPLKWGAIPAYVGTVHLREHDGRELFAPRNGCRLVGELAPISMGEIKGLNPPSVELWERKNYLFLPKNHLFPFLKHMFFSPKYMDFPSIHLFLSLIHVFLPKK